MGKITRKREHGTMEHYPQNPEERIAAFRKVVADGAYAKIDGCMIDLFSANYVVQIYDALNGDNQRKFAGRTASYMVILAFRLAGEKS